MAIKKIFIFFLLLLLLFTFSFACFGSNYYNPTEEEVDLLTQNVLFQSSFSFDNDSITTMSLSPIPSSDFICPSPPLSQFFLIFMIPNGSLYCYPVQFTKTFYYEYDFLLFGANLDLYEEVLFPEPDCEFGLGFVLGDDCVYPSLTRHKASWATSGLVALSYLPREKITFIDSVKNSLSLIISGIGEMTSSFITPGQPLFSLMQLLLLGISITFLFFAVRIIRRFVWGD